MKVIQIPNPNGIDDLKLIGETEPERQWIRQLAEAGTLTSITRALGDVVSFRAMSISADFGAGSYTVDQSLGKFNFTVVQNQNFNYDLRINYGGAPLDLTTFTSGIKLAVKNKNGSTLFELSLGNGLTVTGVDHNVLGVKFTPAQTILLCNDSYYDLLFSKPNSNAYYLQGKIKVIKTGTRNG
jgi:hypothetical protein